MSKEVKISINGNKRYEEQDNERNVQKAFSLKA